MDCTRATRPNLLGQQGGGTLKPAVAAPAAEGSQFVNRLGRASLPTVAHIYRNMQGCRYTLLLM